MCLQKSIKYFLLSNINQRDYLKSNEVNKISGIIYRLYNKQNHKSLIRFANNVKWDLYQLINELKQNKCTINELQNDWNNSYEFIAEDLQLCYSTDKYDINLLINNWKKHFSDTNHQYLYEDIIENYDIDSIMLQYINSKPKDILTKFSTWLMLINKQNIVDSSLDNIDLKNEEFNIYSGQDDLQAWINTLNINAPLFMRQLKKEIEQIESAKRNKGVSIFKDYLQKKSLKDVAEKWNLKNNDVSKRIDSIQHRYPALYLASGLKAYSNKGTEKTARKILIQKGIQDIPAILN